MKKHFLITIDTEGDDLWGNAATLTTRNAGFLERFQTLCERFGFKPCYLTNHEMAIDPVYQAFARDVISRETAEIGMHLHAWNSPPLHPETDHGGEDKAYLIEYPLEVMRAKIATMTHLLEDTFGVKMVSHRAGRWAFDGRYAKLLVEHGYKVDCSVTPHVDWSQTRGARQGRGGTDYREFPESAYWLDECDIGQAGSLPLLEIPMTTRPKYSSIVQGLKDTVNRLRGKSRPRSMSWLRPRGGNAREMITLADRVGAGGSDYLEFMLHSSEFMPGGSPTFRTEADIEELYRDLEALFTHLARDYSGATLAEYHAGHVERHGLPAAAASRA
ncbi:deacetylase [Paludibacterium paludis]|uniref:Deacetylase n=1 Tax=Paludibacterium paludis TaxID=1225769 RepID=A0A918UAF7_9NEIS|nr:deacetylase [Paludibacterium paludis]GGY16598.1 deacetylase [Paludibacterium paludis]